MPHIRITQTAPIFQIIPFRPSRRPSLLDAYSPSVTTVTFSNFVLFRVSFYFYFTNLFFSFLNVLDAMSCRRLHDVGFPKVSELIDCTTRTMETDENSNTGVSHVSFFFTIVLLCRHFIISKLSINAHPSIGLSLVTFYRKFMYSNTSQLCFSNKLLILLTCFSQHHTLKLS